MNRLPLFILILGLFSCNLDGNETSPSTNISVAELTEDLVQNSGLRVVQFIEDGVDETSDYTGFIFNFSTDGRVTATRNDQVVSGTYRVFRDDGETELAMIFPANSVLNEFTDDWYFRGKTNNRITFEDDDPDDDLDRIVFEY
ncbi:MAG: hypothetical protein B7Z16_02805 [Algoriphagus sp. 32-45-6]|nr:MAG: hypothetical protein B7Z16_02805 [Algoriphagus sp. 32-45-6]